MKALNLRVPETDFVDLNDYSPQLSEVSSWINSRLTTDAYAVTDELIQLLQTYNRCIIDNQDRYQMLEQLCVFAKQLSRQNYASYKNAAYPLSDSNSKVYEQRNAMYQELSTGYKLIVLDLFSIVKQDREAKQFLLVVIFKTINLLSRLLVSVYSCYQKEPNGIWSELHSLFKLAYTMGVHNIAIDHFGKQDIRYSIQCAYQRIALLRITNPYQLMQGEAEILFNHLQKWAVSCVLKPVKSATLSAGDVTIDLESDAPPQFVFKYNVASQGDLFYLDMTYLLNRFDATIERILCHKEEMSYGAAVSLKGRLRREMLLRIQQVWKGRMERNENREKENTFYQVSVGLAASHHFISNNDGQSIRNIDSKIPETYNPTRWYCLNSSVRGVGLKRMDICASQAKVGNIVVFLKEDEPRQWQLGLVCWINQSGVNGFEIGIQNIPGELEAATVKCIVRNAAGQTPCSEQDDFAIHVTNCDKKSIIVASETFDVNLALDLVIGVESKRICLKRLVSITSNFSQYEYDLVSDQ